MASGGTMMMSRILNRKPHKECVCVCVCFSVGGVRRLTPVGSSVIVPCISPQSSHLLVQITTLWVGYLIRDEDTSPFCDIYAALSGKHMEFWEFSKQSRMFSCLFPSGSHGCGPSGWCERSLNTTQSPKLWWPLSAKLLQHLNDEAHHRWQRPDHLFIPSSLLGHIWN